MMSRYFGWRIAGRDEWISGRYPVAKKSISFSNTTILFFCQIFCIGVALHPRGVRSGEHLVFYCISHGQLDSCTRRGSFRKTFLSNNTPLSFFLALQKRISRSSRQVNREKGLVLAAVSTLVSEKAQKSSWCTRKVQKCCHELHRTKTQGRHGLVLNVFGYHDQAVRIDMTPVPEEFGNKNFMSIPEDQKRRRNCCTTGRKFWLGRALEEFQWSVGTVEWCSLRTRWQNDPWLNIFEEQWDVNKYNDITSRIDSAMVTLNHFVDQFLTKPYLFKFGNMVWTFGSLVTLIDPSIDIGAKDTYTYGKLLLSTAATEIYFETKNTEPNQVCQTMLYILGDLLNPSVAAKEKFQDTWNFPEHEVEGLHGVLLKPHFRERTNWRRSEIEHLGIQLSTPPYDLSRTAKNKIIVRYTSTNILLPGHIERAAALGLLELKQIWMFA